MDASATSWGSIDRAKSLVQRMEHERRLKGEQTRAKMQGKKSCESIFDVKLWLEKRGKVFDKFVDAKDRREIKKVFESLDADGSGELTIVEVQAAFRVQGLPSSRAVIEKMMGIVDRSGSGQINFEQFVQLMAHARDGASSSSSSSAAATTASSAASPPPGTSPSHAAAAITAGLPLSPAAPNLQTFPVLARAYHTHRSIADLIFRFIDADGSGQINAEELAVAFAHLGIEVTMGQLQRLIKKCDSSGTGLINITDFQLLLNSVDVEKSAKFGPKPKT